MDNFSEEELKKLKESSDKDVEDAKKNLKKKLSNEELVELLHDVSTRLVGMKGSEVTKDDVNNLEILTNNIVSRYHVYDLLKEKKSVVNFYEELWESLTPLHRAYAIITVLSQLYQSNYSLAFYNYMTDGSGTTVATEVSEEDLEEFEEELEDKVKEDDSEEESLGSVLDIFQKNLAKKKNKG